MDLSTWLLFLLTEAVFCFTPGPAVLYVASHGLSNGFRTSFAANLGIVSGNVIYFTASAFGLGALILASHELFLIIKWIGVAYLVWMGMQMLLSRSTASASGSHVGPSARKAFRGGVVLQLANPKNLVFFMAVLPPFIAPGGDVMLQVLILGATSQVIEFTALMIYGGLASRARQWFRRSLLATWLDRAAGAALIGIGASLAFVRRAN